MGDSRDCWQSFCCFLPVIFIDYIICTLLCVITYNSLSAFSRPPPTPACFASPIPYQEIKWNKGDGPFLPAVFQTAIIHCQIFKQVPSRATPFVGPHPQEELSAKPITKLPHCPPSNNPLKFIFGDAHQELTKAKHWGSDLALSSLSSHSKDIIGFDIKSTVLSH